MNNGSLKIKVSVCVPVYKVEKYIERCAVSLMVQSYDDIEYIFVNDNTPDKSWDILENVIVRYPQRKKQVRMVSHEKNRGLAAVRNTAVSLATGDFIMWIDSDDFIEKETVERCVNAQTASDADVVNFDVEIIKQGYKQIYRHPDVVDKKQYCLDMIKFKAPFQIWSRMIRRTIYIDNKINCAEGINQGEDVQVTAKIIYFAKKIVSIHDVLYHYDCTNMNAYTAVFTEDRLRQTWLSHEIVSFFFKDKGPEYFNAVNEAVIGRCIGNLITYGRNPDCEYYYNEACRKLKGLPKDVNCVLPFEKKMVLKIYKHRMLLIFFVKTSTRVRELMKKFF
jgi:glycosyltransferase involved in cell wall biosynthesis